MPREPYLCIYMYVCTPGVFLCDRRACVGVHARRGLNRNYKRASYRLTASCVAFQIHTRFSAVAVRPCACVCSTAQPKKKICYQSSPPRLGSPCVEKRPLRLAAQLRTNEFLLRSPLLFSPGNLPRIIFSSRGKK